MRLSKLRGFTLIETILYIAVVAIIIGGLLTITVSILTGSDKLREEIRLVESKQFVIQKVEWLLSGVSVINSPGANNSSSTLSINKIGSPVNPLALDSLSGVLRLKIGTSSPVAILETSISISNLNFEYNSTTTSETVRVTGVLTGNRSSTTIDYTKILK